MHRDYLLPAIRVIALVIVFFALGCGLAVWLDPSPFVVLAVLVVVWGAMLCSILGMSWLVRLQQRRWLAYWRQASAVDAFCDFDCAPDHCATMQAWCGRAGGAATRGIRTMSNDPRSDIQAYYDILEALDEGDFEVSKWEVDFIDGLLADHPGRLSAKQKDIIERMDEQYLQGRNP